MVELFRCKYNKLHLNCMNPFGELVVSSGRDRSGAGLRGPQRRACGGGFCPKAIFDPALSAALPHWYRGVFSGCAISCRSPLRTTCAFPPRNGFTAAQPGQLRRVRPAVSM